MKKIFSLVLALVMVMGLTTAAWGALAAMPIDGSSDDADGTVNSKIVLNDDVVLTSTYEVAGTLTIDLNGHTISGTDTTALYSLIHVKNGANLTIEDSVGTGKISYAAGTENKTGVAVWVEGALTLESGTIEITGDWVIGFAVDVRPNAWGTAYTEAASFTMDGGKIVASDSGVRVTSNSSDSYPNLGVTFTMNGGTIDSAYDGIFVQNFNYDDTLTVEVVGGTVTSENTHAVRIYGNSDDKVDVEMSITGGSFTGEMTNLDQTGTGEVAISGGTFTDDVSDYVAAGVQQLPNGSVVPSSSIGDNTLSGNYFVKGTGAGAVASAAVVSVTDAKAPKDTDKDGLLDQVGNVKYFNIAGDTAKYIQVASVGEADMIVYYSNTESVFAYLKAVASVEYLGTGVAFNNFGEKCGQYDDEPVAGTKYYLFQGVVYKTVTTSATNLMVGNTLTPVEAMADEFVDHAPAFTYDKAYKVVGVKCAKCGVPATLYANWASIPKAAQADALALGDGRYYVWGAIGAAGTNGGKVQSADTFDAGIAMYVGMSVMAAAGSAVVIGKKKD